jgi:Tol biopolymer transport system component
VGPALSPDGTQVVFQALNQLWLMKIGQEPQQLTGDGYYKCDPSWSPDGKFIAYSSDKAGTEDLYVLDLETGDEQRATSIVGAEVSSAWSPDGSQLAFQDQTGATFVLDLGTGNVRQVIASLFAPSKPSWFKDGKTLAVAALKPYTRRFREGTSQILTVDVASGR